MGEHATASSRGFYLSTPVLTISGKCWIIWKYRLDGKPFLFHHEVSRDSAKWAKHSSPDRMACFRFIQPCFRNEIKFIAQISKEYKWRTWCCFPTVNELFWGPPAVVLNYHISLISGLDRSNKEGMHFSCNETINYSLTPYATNNVQIRCKQIPLYTIVELISYRIRGSNMKYGAMMQQRIRKIRT